MVLRTSGILLKAGNALRHPLTVISGLLALTLLLIGTQAGAQHANFRYNGGRWSHASHAGWNRYWGGPSIGFYYAPTPVYLVSGYAAPSYYTGSTFWTSNPSFGVSLNLGGGGYNGGGGHSNVGHSSGGRSSGGGGSSAHGRSSGGRSSSGGGRSAGGGGNSAHGGSSGGGGRSSSGGGRDHN